MNNQSNVTITELYKVIIYHHASLLTNPHSGSSSHLIWSTIIGIFNLLIVTGRLSIVSNHIDNVSKLLNILLTEDLRIHHVPVSHYTASMISPPCGDCTYLPICLHKDEEKEEKEDCPGQTANTGKIILNYLKLFYWEIGIWYYPMFICLCL